MNRQTLKRLMVKGTVAYVAVFSLALMVAMPAIAVIAARNSVNSAAIIDHTIRSRDIRNKAVTTNRIAPRAVRTWHIKNGAVTAAKINSARLNADLLDGAHASAFAGAGHNHNAAYVNDNAGEVDGADIANGSIRNADIAWNANIADSKILYSAKIGYLSIPAAILTPNHDGYDYQRLKNLRMMAREGEFQAPVYLPQGARVTKLRYYVLDNVSDVDNRYYTSAFLTRISNYQSSVVDMAGTGKSITQPGWRILQTTNIGDATINNNLYAYYVRVWLGYAHTDLRAGNIVIEYTYYSPGS